MYGAKRNQHDRFEVEQILERLELENEKLKHNNAILRRQLESTTTQLEMSQRRYHQLGEEVRAKERASEEMARMAVKEANKIIDTAHRNGDIIVREALSTARQVLVEIARISNESNDLRIDLNERLKKLEHIIQGLEFPDVPNVRILNKEHDKFSR